MSIFPYKYYPQNSAKLFIALNFYTLTMGVRTIFSREDNFFLGGGHPKHNPPLLLSQRNAHDLNLILIRLDIIYFIKRYIIEIVISSFGKDKLYDKSFKR